MPSKSTPLGEDGSGSHNGSHLERDEALGSASTAANERPAAVVNGTANGAHLPDPHGATTEPNDNEPDSEAETVRLDSSPAKKRVISEQLANPSKRARPANPNEPTRVDEESGDEARIAAKDIEPTSTAVNTNGSGQHSEPAAEQAAEEAAEQAAEAAEQAEPAEPAPEPVEPQPKPTEPESPALETAASQNGDSRNGAETDDGQQPGNGSAAGEAAEAVGEDAGAESAPESGAESNADSDDEAQSVQKERQEAIAALTEIEIEFAHLRDELFDEHVKRYDLEIAMCDNGTHPELATVYESIQSRHNERVDRGQAQRDYRLQCLRNQTVAMRAHMHQQFIKDRFDLRSEMLDRTTAQWYKVNYAHRAAERAAEPAPGVYGSLPSAAPPAPTAAGVPAANPHVMDALQSYVGFPAAPAVAQASEMEAYEDLTAMGIRSL